VLTLCRTKISNNSSFTNRCLAFFVTQSHRWYIHTRMISLHRHNCSENTTTQLTGLYVTKTLQYTTHTTWYTSLLCHDDWLGRLLVIVAQVYRGYLSKSGQSKSGKSTAGQSMNRWRQSKDLGILIWSYFSQLPRSVSRPCEQSAKHNGSSRKLGE